MLILRTCLFSWTVLALLVHSSTSYGQSPSGKDNPADSEVSPALKIERGPRPQRRPPRDGGDPSVRTIDSSFNNLENPEMGAAGTPLQRYLDSDYADGVSEMAGPLRPGPREISNAVADQSASIPNTLQASDWLWLWGQFLDHDIDLSGGADPAEPAPISVPVGDPFFDPDFESGREIAFNRSIYDPASGTQIGNPRQQLNEITAWIDASNVYGSDGARALALRTNDGTGRLKTSPGNLLPFNEDGLPNAGGPSPQLFLAGDVRANEQAALIAIHSLFVREHNRRAVRLAERHPNWSGERLYQQARRMVGAHMQVVTYREFLPALLGPDALQPYQGYDSSVDGRIMNIFSTAAYRFGHSALSPTLLRLDEFGREIPQGHLALRDAFFDPTRITLEGGIEPLLRGLSEQRCQRIDPFVVDEVRNFLFGAPGQGGFDLVSLNIQRGRDHGLPSYNAAREALGFDPALSFEEISSETEIQRRLAGVYDNVDEIDLWIGGLCEDPSPGSHLGVLFTHILSLQFEALRDGDRFWYQNHLSDSQIMEVEETRLSDLVRRNTSIDREIPKNIFRFDPDGRDGNRRR